MVFLFIVCFLTNVNAGKIKKEIVTVIEIRRPRLRRLCCTFMYRKLLNIIYYYTCL